MFVFGAEGWGFVFDVKGGRGEEGCRLHCAGGHRDDTRERSSKESRSVFI